MLKRRTLIGAGGPWLAALASHAQPARCFVQAPTLLLEQRQRWVELTLKHRLPTMFHQRGYVTAGGLMAYGADVIEIWHHAVTCVDKIVKGAEPGDLPVQQPTRFEFVINLKTAKALGLTIPPALLARVDEVVD